MVSIKINAQTCRGYLLKVSLIFSTNKQNSLYPDQLIIISHLLGYKYNFLNNNLITHPVSIQLFPEYSISPLSCLYSRWEVTYSEARSKGQWESLGSFFNLEILVLWGIFKLWSREAQRADEMEKNKLNACFWTALDLLGRIIEQGAFLRLFKPVHQHNKEVKSFKQRLSRNKDCIWLICLSCRISQGPDEWLRKH